MQTTNMEGVSLVSRSSLVPVHDICILLVLESMVVSSDQVYVNIDTQCIEHVTPATYETRQFTANLELGASCFGTFVLKVK